MAVFLKLGQVLLVFSFFAFLAPAHFAQGDVNRMPVQPRRKLRNSTKTLGVAKSRPKDIWNDFFDVCNFPQIFVRKVIKFPRISVEKHPRASSSPVLSR